MKTPAKTCSLTFGQQCHLLSQVAELAENMGTYSRELRLMGYQSFRAWDAFVVSFCLPAEIMSHRRFVIDDAKRFIRTPHAVFLENDRHAWNARPDPCEARLRNLGEGDAQVIIRREMLTREFARYRILECETIASPERKVTEGLVSCDSYASLFGYLLHECFQRCGFQADARRSKKDYPVVSKTLTDGWDICWSPESNRTLLSAGIWPFRHSEDPRQWPELDLECYLRAKGTRGYAFVPMGFEALSVMKLRIHRLVPGFGWAYLRFNGFEELPIVMGAHAKLYQMVGPKLEEILKVGLNRLELN